MEKKVQNVQKEGGLDGNTISSSPSLNWCFTLNNYTEENYNNVLSELRYLCKMFVVGKEIGSKKNTPHLQGFMIFKTKKRFETIKAIGDEFNKMHLEKCRNIKASIDYCKKEGTYFCYPEEVKINIITELRPWQADIEKLILGEIDNRKIYWYWEDTGNFGKSALCKYLYIKYKCLIIQGGNHADIINGVFNYDMDKCRAVIIDMPRCNKHCAISYSAIECIKNGMIFNTKYETGCKVFNSVHVIVFSNQQPNHKDIEKLSEDRWEIKELLNTVDDKQIYINFE